MREISKDELQEILENHKHWLNRDCNRWESMRANLQEINLQWANLQRADLQRADLHWADLHWADLQKADLQGANLQGADLRRTNLHGANLQGADIDFSCLPLWCGSLSANFDSRQLKQIAYHLVKAGLQSKNATEEDKTELRKLIDYANGFHRAYECGVIEDK